MSDVILLAEKLYKNHSLTVSEYEKLISQRTSESAKYLTEKADEVRKGIYGN